VFEIIRFFAQDFVIFRECEKKTKTCADISTSKFAQEIDYDICFKITTMDNYIIQDLN